MSDIEATKIRIFKTHTKIPHKLIVRHDEFSMHFNIVLLPIIDLVKNGIECMCFEDSNFRGMLSRKKTCGEKGAGTPGAVLVVFFGILM